MVAMTQYELDRTATEPDRAFAVPEDGEPRSRSAAGILDPWTGDEVDSKDVVDGLC
jgi:hypothetical protein